MGEVNNVRSDITGSIVDFTNQYPANKHLITCRIAATEYTFEKFTYVEMADFTPAQVRFFARKWFAPDEAKAQRFVDEFELPEHRGLRELAQTPLLLTLLCLAFEEKLTFPARRVDLYEEALSVLLKKWDASRNIKRDEAYRGLSLDRKQRLFADVAAEFFERDEIFFRQSDLAQCMSAFLKSLPEAEVTNEPDGEAVLKAVEAQHGLFVEHAHCIYSFSHLAVQEYFTAKYIVDHAADGALERLIKHHFMHDRWHEVFLLTASMLPEADAFFAAFQRALDELQRGDEYLLAYSHWAVDKAHDYAYLGHPAVARATATLARALNHSRDLPALDLDLAFIFVRHLAQVGYPSMDHLLLAIAQACEQVGQAELTQALNNLHLPAIRASRAEWETCAHTLQAVLIQSRNIGYDWKFTDEQQQRINLYEQGTALFETCLKLATVSDRKAIEDRLLLPPV